MQQLCGWTSTTYLVTHKATNSDVDSDDDSFESNDNKWSATNIDMFFKDFEKFNLPQMKAWAEDFWTDMDAELAATDGQSTSMPPKLSLNSFLVPLSPLCRS